MAFKNYLFQKYVFFSFIFFFQIIYLKFVSVASDHFSFGATFETMVDPQFLQQPGQGSSHLLVFLKDIFGITLEVFRAIKMSGKAVAKVYRQL